MIDNKKNIELDMMCDDLNTYVRMSRALEICIKKYKAQRNIPLLSRSIELKTACEAVIKETIDKIDALEDEFKYLYEA